MMIEGNCKINLALNVEGLLPNGYHKVKTIMQEITLSDEISLDFGKSGVSLSCSNSLIPTDNKNIAYRAAELFYDRAHIADGVHIHIQKAIPFEAGLGGGSADGAAVLKAMNANYGYPFTDNELEALGLSLGADVPFFIKGGTALAEGIGEKLTPVDSKIKGNILIVKPPFGISTPWAYKQLDERGFAPAKVDDTKKALETGDLEALCKTMSNVFEQISEAQYPEIAAIKSNLIKKGGKGAMMSGSGTAVFGIFRDENSLDLAYEYFKKQYSDVFKAKMV